jgi:lipoteichoic acid synthase
MQRLSASLRDPSVAIRAWRAIRGACGPAALGAWLLAKQLVWSPVQAGQPVHAGAVAASAAVALLVLAVATRFRGRAQLAALLALDALLTGTYQVHLLYHRQFHELASVAALPFALQAAGVARAVGALFRPGDALLWADLAALAALAVLGRARAGPPARRRSANVLALAAALLFAAATAPLLFRPLTGPRRVGVARAEVASALNVVGYQLFDLATYARRHLDGSARDALPEAFAYHRGRAWSRGALSATQRGRNVIVVQLESVQAFAVGRRVNDVPVTPSLDRVAEESIRFTRALSQVGQGTTSDAELLAGCSLYPLQTGAVFTERYDVDFRCLPELLREAGYYTVAMHANWPNFWNRDRMYPAMGYGEFLSLRSFDREPVVGLGLSDARFAEQAAERISALPEPFYAVLITLSNHAPFVDPNLPRTLPLGALRETAVGAYLDSVAFTDAALGTLLERLRATGVLDRSVLVVYGDHHGVTREATGTAALGLAMDRADFVLLHEARVPLLVRLAGGRHPGPRHEPAGLIDVAPTILDLLGLAPEGVFFHGRSLVAGAPAPVILPDGSAVSEELVYLGGEGRWGPPRTCVDAATGAPVAASRCDALAEHAARELAISRAEVNGDLFRWMMPRDGPRS